MALEAINNFRAVRKFTDQPVPDDVLGEILNAGRRSQSAKNTQPWQFIVVRDRDQLKRISECGDYAQHVAGATFAVVIVAPQNTEYDQGHTTAYMMLAVRELGVGSCIATLHHEDKGHEVLGVPVDLSCRYAISFGYPADDQDRPLRRGGRQPLDDLLHFDKW